MEAGDRCQAQVLTAIEVQPEEARNFYHTDLSDGGVMPRPI